MKKTKTIAGSAGLALLALVFMTAFKVNTNPGEHPAYLHALSDLRAARWMLDHRPGNWKVLDDESVAIRQIDMAIDEIRKASIDDGKDVNWHPKMDEHPDHPGRLRDAAMYLHKAHEDVNKDEDNNFAKGLRNRALMHIDASIQATEKAIKNVR